MEHHAVLKRTRQTFMWYGKILKRKSKVQNNKIKILEGHKLLLTVLNSREWGWELIVYPSVLFEFLNIILTLVLESQWWEQEQTFWGTSYFLTSMLSAFCAFSCLDFHKNRNCKLVTIIPFPWSGNWSFEGWNNLFKVTLLPIDFL